MITNFVRSTFNACRFAWAGLLLASLTFVACDDNTGEMGTSLIGRTDNLNISTDTFRVATRSYLADSVYARNAIGYIGKVRDPETGGFIVGDFMTQFHILEDYEFPAAENIVSRENGEIIADSCELRLYFNDLFGDSLATMKLTAMEMGTAMNEGNVYYSNFDPEKEGLIREGGIKVDKAYTLTNNIRIQLNDSCWDKDGKGYKNYGSYILNAFYKNPENFKNSYNFANNVVPGFYFKNVGGLGNMAYINMVQLNIYFRYTEEDTTYVGTSSFAGTEEVLQATRITNNKTVMSQLAAVDTCTFIKSPAGILTELELPIDSILAGRPGTAESHESDSINSAKLILQCMNNNTDSEYALPAPTRLLLLPVDSLSSFFENSRIIDYRTSYLSATSTSSTSNQTNLNTYSFNNINGLITAMNANRTSENWNKVLIIPVKVTTNSSNQITSVVHDMSLTSTKLVRGYDYNDTSAAAKAHAPVKISVIYSKFK